jgi:hypothetical protein
MGANLKAGSFRSARRSAGSQKNGNTLKKTYRAEMVMGQ